VSLISAIIKVLLDLLLSLCSKRLTTLPVSRRPPCIFHPDREYCLFHVYLSIFLLEVIEEISFIYAFVAPNVLSGSLFLVSHELADVKFVILCSWLPLSQTLSVSFTEWTRIIGAVLPYVFTLAVEFSIRVITDKTISIFE